MDEILELQRLLAEVQEQTCTNKFSDRVIVELVNKIINDYGLHLIYSQDGQEYMTPEHLDEQLAQLISERGRIQVLEIPPILNVTEDVVENRVPKIIKKNKKDFIRVGNEVITSNYLNQICEEINEDLQQQSQIFLFELTSKYSLTLQFLKEQLQYRIDNNIIDGNIIGDKLCTLTYQELTKSKFRGLFRGATKPILLSSLAKDYQIEQRQLQEIIEDLISSEAIEGKIISGQFVPTRFQRNQENTIRDFLKQNKYIEYSMLQKLFIQKPEETLKQMFRDQIILLDDCAFYKDSLEELKEQIVNLLLEEGYTDLSFMFPTCLTEADIETIVNKHLKLTEVELDETMIFSHHYIEKCVTGLKQNIITQLQENPQKAIQKDKTLDDSDDDSEDGGKKKKGGKGKKQPPAASASVSTRAFENKKDKKGGAQKPTKKQTEEQRDKGNNLFNQDEFISILLEAKIINQNDKGDDFENKLYRIAQPSLQKYIEQLRKEMMDKKKSGSQEVIMQLNQLIEDAMLMIQISQNSITYIENNHSDINMTLFSNNIHYTLRLVIENTIVLICKKLAISLPQGLFIKKDEEDPSKNIQIATLVLKKVFKSKEMLQQAISLLPKEYNLFLIKAFELYLKKQPKPLIEYLMNNTQLMGVRAILDKKIEKNLILTTKYYIKDLIKKDKADNKLNFLRTVQYILLDKFGQFYIGNLDSKFISSILIILSDLSKEMEDISPLYSQTLALYKQITKEKKDEIPDSKISDEQASVQFESSLHSLIKATKM
ncbi:hypothetical protein TTHERM_00354710 (macronuclear) [Tetrahymena thermophila SB210]|uniref:E3 UFM1-protein ligase 1-like N-terminal domain-containing protein n=1 Tax=Tetrahymena thermophila (strain SB210) TaxID=312017 RepID=Q22YA0_TETTS|nr:hypothetical protein TTHERM_00354710 [Tetrahymena thermophila SB210]EAR90124.1 hypothetical protein TTHERM_00354710 [Tetrahymena thermophila SB210]|eukprot:XP_001010369.1 hypothetical protein TTHERM_00354710 [Tetrahymena thermophila SB210]